jgi:hypothetical protein
MARRSVCSRLTTVIEFPGEEWGMLKEREVDGRDESSGGRAGIGAGLNGMGEKRGQ